MRILAFSDLHCDREAARNVVVESSSADVVLGAGDFGIRGDRSIELFEILKEIKVPLVIVSGNHDRRSDLASYCATQNNIYLLDGSSQEINGIKIFGLGGEIPSRNDAEWNETLEEAEATEQLRRAKDHHVLLTHTPPHGYCDLQKNGANEGSEAIANAIRSYAPSLCLCGHIHHSWGATQQLGKTTVHNLGPKPCWHSISDAK